jgi:hypothetical protein
MAASLLLLHLSVFLLALIHRSAWNKNSAKFAFWGSRMYKNGNRVGNALPEVQYHCGTETNQS